MYILNSSMGRSVGLEEGCWLAGPSNAWVSPVFYRHRAGSGQGRPLLRRGAGGTTIAPKRSAPPPPLQNTCQTLKPIKLASLCLRKFLGSVCLKSWPKVLSLVGSCWLITTMIPVSFLEFFPSTHGSESPSFVPGLPAREKIIQ